MIPVAPPPAPITLPDDLHTAAAMDGAARSVDDADLKALYVAHERGAITRAKARIDALEISCRSLEAELVRVRGAAKGG